MPPYATAYSLRHNIVIPRDYYGFKTFGEISIYDPQNYQDWSKRAPYEITNFFQNKKEKLLLIKGFGLISYDRDLTNMVKNLAILENSCKLLTLSRVNK